MHSHPILNDQTLAHLLLSHSILGRSFGLPINTILRFNSRIHDVLCDLFAERMPQDKHYKYKPDTVNVYFENRIKATIHPVDVRKTIKEITTDKKYELVFHIAHSYDIPMMNSFFPPSYSCV